MRSLTLKLMFAFLLVGVIGVALVALLVGLATRSEFNRFLSTRDQAVLVDALEKYYATHGSWEGAGAMIDSTPPLDFYRRNVALADANAVVVLANFGYTTGQTLPRDALNGSTPVVVNGQTVGYMMLPRAPDHVSGPNKPLPPEVDFLQRVTWAIVASAGVAALFALLLGGILAQTLTRPLRELIAATKTMARGTFGQRVTVRSRDEIGELATSFNQMNADLARASQLRRQMTADLAHDLRTPLSILRGYTEGLKDARLAGSPPLYGIMHDEVVHLQRLVDDLRVLSLADAGELPLSRRAVDPAALIERTGLAYIVQAEQQGIALRVEAPENLPSVMVDIDRMSQVLNNLVSNALRYTPEGAIVLSASSELRVLSSELAGDLTETQNSKLKTQNCVVLSVSDTGSGIAAEDLPFIFDRFYRADQSRQRNDDTSSGLGLAIAKAIVEAHGGTISVSSALGHGTEFTIGLPVSDSHFEGQGHDKAAPKPVAAETHAS
jgi:two-component system sensor histidine kinase BaeS